MSDFTEDEMSTGTASTTGTSGGVPGRVLRIGLVGESGVGKSTLAECASRCASVVEMGERPHSMHTPTCGVDIVPAKSRLTGGQVIFIDVSGHERFSDTASSNVKWVDVVCVVYNVADIRTFQEVQKWVNLCRAELGDEMVGLLVAFQVDRRHERQVTYDMGKDCAKEHHLSYVEASAAVATSVSDLVDKCVDKALRKTFIKTRLLMDDISYNDQSSVLELDYIQKQTRQQCCVLI